MIRINLLPTKKRASKKITELQQQFLLGILILVLVGIGLFAYARSLNTKIENLTKTKAAAEARIREQENMLKEVKTVADERKKVTDKINVIEQLKKNQTMLVHLLDDVSKALPQGVNIASLSEDNRKVRLEGEAFTNYDVVRFIENLKATPSMTDVYLEQTVQTSVAGIEIYKYKLKFNFKGA